MAKFWKRQPEVLLSPNIPQPLHGVAPRVIMGNSWWNKTRKAAYEATNFHCHACGIHRDKAKFRQWLEAHEIYEVDYKRGTATYIKAVALCHACHNFIHDGRLTGLLERGEIHHYKYSYILNHGQNTLLEAGLYRPPLHERDRDIMDRIRRNECARWEEWRMILFDKEYPSLFPTIEAYNEHWNTNDLRYKHED